MSRENVLLLDSCYSLSKIDKLNPERLLLTYFVTLFYNPWTLSINILNLYAVIRFLTNLCPLSMLLLFIWDVYLITASHVDVCTWKERKTILKSAYKVLESKQLVESHPTEGLYLAIEFQPHMTLGASGLQRRDYPLLNWFVT